MRSILFLCLFLVGFAPVPTIKPVQNLNSEFSLFQKRLKVIPEDQEESHRKRFTLRLDAYLQSKNISKDPYALEVKNLAKIIPRENPLLEDKITAILEVASIRGKYRELLHQLYVPEDLQIYSNYNDAGFWVGTSYSKYSNLEKGFWVYLYPYWYVWKVDTTQTQIP